MSRLLEGVKSLKQARGTPFGLSVANSSSSGPDLAYNPRLFATHPKAPADSGIGGQILDSNLEVEALIRLQSNP